MKLSVLLLVAVAVTALAAADRGSLRAGAARVDISPPGGAALPMAGYAGRTQGFKGIHDPVYVRAIVLDDGATQVAIVVWESLFVPESVWAETSQRISSEAGIRPENLILAAVHDHSAPTLGGGRGPAPAGSAAYTKSVEDNAVQAVRRAKAQLQPARFGIGTGTADINVNRDEQSPAGLWLGYNEKGPSDKTVSVIRFEDLSGKPIAFLINYAVHAVIMGPSNYQVSGDLAGATSRFVERHYSGEDHPRGDTGPRLVLQPAERASGEGVVALWTSGTAGDQNPISVASGEDFSLVNAFGKVLGEEVVRVAGAIKTTPEARLRGAQQVATCPGRRVERGATPRAEYKFTDTDPVPLRLTLLMLDDIALAGVSGEVFTAIGQRLKKESPWNHTIVITHANGSSGYIPNDAAFEPVGYEVTASRLKPGCAEGAIVNGFLDLMRSR